ncbi:hypothetical protein [Streptomyces zhihengii]
MDAFEPGALIGEAALDLPPALQFQAELQEERDGGVHVLDHDADVVHPLNRHAALSFCLVRPVPAALSPLGRSRCRVLDIRSRTGSSDDGRPSS